MKAKSEHWNEIFSAKTDGELGWYEEDVSQTLKFIEDVPLQAGATVFLPGAGTSLLVDELLARGHELILNDISREALTKLRDRVGTDSRLSWLCHDISQPLPKETPQADLWIDRAVLHFLLEETEIEGYFSNLRATVKAGGWVLLAEFSTTGAPKCAGLDLHRYSIEEMKQRMGREFTLVRHEDYVFINPFGDPRPYIYALFGKTE